jgi:mannose-6-phosphate isomerase-like protein (cupin superfamily)
MRAIAICLGITVVTAALVAQRGGPQPDVTYRSAADVAAMIAKAKAQFDTKAAPTISQNILRLAPYNTNLEYRAAVGPASVHLKEAEVFYVIDGSGTLITGGKLANQTQNGDNLSGTGIEGGKSQTMSKGDFAIVPQGTPHWFSEIKMSPLVLMSMHVPRTDDAK